MIYNDTAVIIPLLATGYLLGIYLLLMLAQRTIKSSRYFRNSWKDAYANYVTNESLGQTTQVERWSPRASEAASQELPSVSRELAIPLSNQADSSSFALAEPSRLQSLNEGHAKNSNLAQKL